MGEKSNILGGAVEACKCAVEKLADNWVVLVIVFLIVAIFYLIVDHKLLDDLSYFTTEWHKELLGIADGAFPSSKFIASCGVMAAVLLLVWGGSQRKWLKADTEKSPLIKQNVESEQKSAQNENNE